MLTACSTIMNNLPGVYTLDIQQGNKIDQDMINQLRPNMTKRQVLYIMGSPMLMDVFHNKRWDFLYSVHVDHELEQKKQVTLFFEGDFLAGIEGDYKPNINAPKVVKETIIEAPKRDLDLTLWEKITWLFSTEPSTTLDPETQAIEPETTPTN